MSEQQETATVKPDASAFFCFSMLAIRSSRLTGYNVKSEPPIVSTSPAFSIVGSLTGTPLMADPFFEFRSLYFQTPSESRMSVP